MKALTLQERLLVYQRALKHYRISYWIPFTKGLCNTDYGFCVYFGLIGITIDELPELNSIRPVIPYLSQRTGLRYWFKPGKAGPRISLLKKAIEETKKLIQQN